MLALLPAALPAALPLLLPAPALRPPRRCTGGGGAGVSDGGDIGLGGLDVGAAASLTVVAGRSLLPRRCAVAEVDVEVSGLRDGGDTRLDDPGLCGERLEGCRVPPAVAVVVAGVAGGAYGGGDVDWPGEDRPCCGSAQEQKQNKNEATTACLRAAHEHTSTKHKTKQ